MALRLTRLYAAFKGHVAGRDADMQDVQDARVKEIIAANPDAGIWRLLGRFLASQYLYTDPAGKRHVGWRTWFLLWLLPVVTLGAALVVFLEIAWRQQAGMLVEAEVVQVYQWEGDTPFDRGEAQFSPVFTFEDARGRQLRLTPGLRHADWNYPVGSRHMVRYVDGAGRVTIPGTLEYKIPAVVGLVGLFFALVALFFHLRLRRWERGGAA